MVPIVDCNLLRANVIRTKGGAQTYTPTFTAFTVGTGAQSFKYVIYDTMLHIEGTITQSTIGSASGSEYQISFPSGCTARTGVCGTAFITDSGTGGIVGVCRCTTGVSFVVTFNDPASASPLIKRWGITADTPASLRFDSAPLTATFNVTVFLSPASAILAGTQ